MKSDEPEFKVEPEIEMPVAEPERSSSSSEARPAEVDSSPEPEQRRIESPASGPENAVPTGDKVEASAERPKRDRYYHRAHFGYWEFAERVPNLDRPKVTNEYIESVAERAVAFFETEIAFRDDQRRFFYEGLEHEYLKKTLGRYARGGDFLLDVFMDFKSVCERNNRNFVLFYNSLAIILNALIVLAVAMYGPQLPGWGALSSLLPGVSALTLAIVAPFLLLVLLVAAIGYPCYKMFQKQSALKFDNYIQTQTNNLRERWQHLYQTLQDFENRKGEMGGKEARTKLPELAGKYALSLHWSSMVFYLLDTGLRNVLFRIRRNAAVWRFGGACIALASLIGLALCLEFLPLYGAMPAPNLELWLAAMGTQALLVVAGSWYTRRIGTFAEIFLKDREWMRFHSLGIPEEISALVKRDKRTILMYLDLRKTE